MIQNNEIKALLNLLDDPDEEVFNNVKQKLLSYGKTIVPNLEDFWGNSTDELIQNRIENVLRHLNFDDLLLQFKEWASNENPDLLEGMLLLNFYRFSNPDNNNTRKQVKTIYQSAWLEMNNYLSPMEQVNILASIIYNMYKLQSQEINVNNINYFFIHHLLQNKNGNVHSLNSIYLILCDLLNIPIKAVSIPEQFLLAYFDTVYNYLTPHLPPQNKILFYIDAATGMVYTQSDVDAYLKKMNLPLQDDNYITPLENKQFVKIFLQQLLKCYETEDLINEKEKEILQLIDILES